jgi:histidinol-phosphate aminotransferase
LGFKSADQIVKLASNENALGPSPRGIKAMRENASAMHRYPDGGAYYLRQAIAKKLNVTPEQIAPGNGSNEIIELLGHVFLSPQTGIVMADRAFVVYRIVAAASQSGVIAVPMREFTHDLDAMLRAIRPDTRLVFISNPNNPTSTMVGQGEIDRFMAAVPDHVVVCFDEAYIELLDPAAQPDVLQYVRQGRNVVVLRTFSKTYGMAGLRIGYAVAPESCVQLLDRARQPFNVNAMALAAATAALDDDEHVARTRKMVKDGLACLTREFERMGLAYVPAAANFILVEVGKGREVFEALLREGVIVRPMDGYGLPRHVRVTVGTETENEKCVEALGVVLAVKAGSLTA